MLVCAGCLRLWLCAGMQGYMHKAQPQQPSRNVMVHAATTVFEVLLRAAHSTTRVARGWHGSCGALPLCVRCCNRIIRMLCSSRQSESKTWSSDVQLCDARLAAVRCKAVSSCFPPVIAADSSSSRVIVSHAVCFQGWFHTSAVSPCLCVFARQVLGFGGFLGRLQNPSACFCLGSTICRTRLGLPAAPNQGVWSSCVIVWSDHGTASCISLPCRIQRDLAGWCVIHCPLLDRRCCNNTTTADVASVNGTVACFETGQLLPVEGI